MAPLLIFLLASVYAQDYEWQKYIVGPQTLNVYPECIISTGGSVTNPEGLLPGGEGDTILERIEGEDAPFVIVDFGLNTVGFLTISFNGASDNTPGIRLAFSETQQYLSDTCDYTRSGMSNPITPGSDQIAVREEPYTWANTWGCENETKVCTDGIHGFRYLKIYLDAIEEDAPITSPTGKVSISAISLKYSAFLPTPDTFEGWFTCSDEELTHFWYSGVYTNDLTTDIFRPNDVDPRGADTPGLEGRLVLFDGAKRDRDPYVGDVAVSGRTTYLSHGNYSSIAARNVLADLGDHQRDDGWIPPASVMNYSLQLFDYPLWWVVSVWDYVLHTGDETLLIEYFPHIVRVLDEYYPTHTNEESQLLSKPDGEGDFAFVPRTGEVAYYNALYVLALKFASASARFLEKDDIATSWDERAGNVSLSFSNSFWDDSVGAYRNFKSESTSSHPQDGNALAVVSGIADLERAESALSYLERATSRPYGNAFMDDDSLVDGGSQRVYAFMSTFDIMARFLIDADNSALDEIKRLYGWMHTHDPEVTYWEGVGAEGSMYQGGFTSAAHGWSTGVVSLLTNYVLGLTPLVPGGLIWNVEPHPGYLTWAVGTVPSTEGPLQGGWINSNETFTVELSIPAGVTANVLLPTYGDNWRITHNGIEKWSNGVGAGVERNDRGRVVLPNIGGGKHIIVATKL